MVAGPGAGDEVWFGDPDLLAHWRSACKPFQALPLVADGGAERYGLDDADIGLCCASHAGTPAHVERAEGILDRIGLGAESLACGPHRPFDDEAARALAREGREPTALHNNCSGKHAGMLVQAVHAGVSPEGYERPEHPVQARIRDELGRWLDADPEGLAWATDGCGLPTPYLSLRGMARAYARLVGEAAGGEGAARRVVSAMIEHPNVVAGPERLTTRLLEAGEGRLLAKEGAEGVLCLAGVDGGWGLALKVADGASRATGPAAAEAVRRLELLGREAVQRLESVRVSPVRNTLDATVGEIRPRLELREAPVPTGS